MKHLFVPYELALLAKEKGFDELCLACYNSQGNLQDDGYYGLTRPACNKGNKPEYPAAPLYQQLVDWFRKKHGILIHQVLGFHKNHWCFKIQDIKSTPKNIDTIQEDSYYEAFNEALTEAFKLI